MPIKIVDWYLKADLRGHPLDLYVFGDNFERRGRAGQAKECRDEPNAVGIATKKYPGWSERCYLTDKDLEKWCSENAVDIERIENHLRAGGTVVFSSQGLGSGLADLPKRAPNLYKYIEMWIGRLKAQYGVVSVEEHSE